jgi:dihydropteroate synthase
MLLTEGEAVPLSRLDHALYLGRELQKAERCLDTGEPYVQD